MITKKQRGDLTKDIEDLLRIGGRIWKRTQAKNVILQIMQDTQT